jgi:hypothetical protein
MAKAKETAAEGAGPVEIRCPACESSIASDGKTLHSKSKRFVELEEVESGLGEVSEALEKAEKRITALEAENTTLKGKGKTPNVPVEEKDDDADPDRELTE